MSKPHRGSEVRGQESLRDRRVLEFLPGVPVLYRPVEARALAGKCSPRSAIKAFCLTCTGFVRRDITDCTALACPLWLYRPYQAEGEDE